MKYIRLLMCFLLFLGMSDLQAKKDEDKTYEQMLLIKDCHGFIAYGSIIFNKPSEAPKIIKAINKNLKDQYKEALSAYNTASKAYKTWLAEQKLAKKEAEKAWKAEHPDASRSDYKKYLEEQLIANEYEAWAAEQGDKLPKTEKKAHKNFFKWVKKHPARHYSEGVPRRPTSPSVRVQGGRVKQPGSDDSDTKYTKFSDKLSKKAEFADMYNTKLAKHLGLEGAPTDLEMLFSIGAPE